jgi:FkbM family methyltransferase
MKIPPIELMNEALRSAMNTGMMRASFSQMGEDAVLWWIFHARRNGFYVDVGCHHPFRFSNTALLHIANNWRGINIDVDERAIKAFNEARPNDINICVAVGDTAGKMEVTLFEDGAVNSLHPVFAENLARVHRKKEKRMVEVRPLRDILTQHVPPDQRIDFLNIDAEALDFSVLLSNDWDKFAPEVIAIEVHGFNMAAPQNNRTFKFLNSMGYTLISHIVMTSIYRRKS